MGDLNIDNKPYTQTVDTQTPNVSGSENPPELIGEVFSKTVSPKLQETQPSLKDHKVSISRRKKIVEAIVNLFLAILKFLNSKEETIRLSPPEKANEKNPVKEGIYYKPWIDGRPQYTTEKNSSEEKTVSNGNIRYESVAALDREDKPCLVTGTFENGKFAPKPYETIIVKYPDEKITYFGFWKDGKPSYGIEKTDLENGAFKLIQYKNGKEISVSTDEKVFSDGSTLSFEGDTQPVNAIFQDSNGKTTKGSFDNGVFTPIKY